MKWLIISRPGQPISTSTAVRPLRRPKSIRPAPPMAASDTAASKAFTMRTASYGGKWPKSFKNSRESHIYSGGTSQNSVPPSCGSHHCPPSAACRTTAYTKGSSCHKSCANTPGHSQTKASSSKSQGRS